MTELTKSLLGYWRASMASALLARFREEVSSYEVSWPTIVKGQLDTKLVQALVRDYSALKSNGTNQLVRSDLSGVKVLIAPLVFIARHSHGIARRKQDHPYAPLIIPAFLSRDGKLSVLPEPRPWVTRSALDPSRASEPAIGTLDDFDHFRSTRVWLENANWPLLIQYVEELCLAVTNENIPNVQVESYDRAPALIQAGEAPSPTTRHLTELASFWEDRWDVLPGALRQLITVSRPKVILTEDQKLVSARAHVGQMGDAFPLDAAQRDTLHHVLAMHEGDLIAVNGPPGTGKTTLIQNIVANSYVTAALAEASPPLIVVSAATRQAIQNVLDTFAVATGRDTKDVNHYNLRGRWLSQMTSFGVYLPSASQEVNEGKYHVARLPNYGRPFSGPLAEILEPPEITSAEQGYLSTAARVLKLETATVSKVREELLLRIRKLKRQLESAYDVMETIATARRNFLGRTLDQARTQMAEEYAKAQQHAQRMDQETEEVSHQASSELQKIETLKTACDEALKVFSPPGIRGLFLNLFPKFRAARWDKCRTILHKANLNSGLATLTRVPNEEDLRAFIDKALVTQQSEADVLSEKARVCLSESQYFRQSQLTEISKKCADVERWAKAETAWRTIVDCLQAYFPEREENDSTGRVDLIAEPKQAERLLDVTVRHEMFLLASHYWEARWLEFAKDACTNGDLDQLRKRKDQEYCEKRFRHMSMLVPCFIATLYMLPDHFKYYDKDKISGVTNPPFTNVVDLLIVDESGQAPAEVGAPALALAKRVVVIGDIYQIEPVWSVGPQEDASNLTKVGLQHGERMLEEAGALAHSGSLMKLARRATVFKRADEEHGLYLSEHRRCQSDIIQICKDLVYGDKLMACAQPLLDPILPRLGWANIRASSHRRGRSRSNVGEAEAIADWLSQRRPQIEERYRKELEEAVGIVTPFSNQKGTLRKALAEYQISETITVGTIHALQGAEREIIIFSPVHTAEDGSDAFFDRGPNMVNVAVSRAKHSFLVFGDMRIFYPTRPSLPSGVLGRHLHQNGTEILDAISRPEFVLGENRSYTRRIESLGEHRATLVEALTTAKERILIVSPYLSSAAIRKDNIPALIKERAKVIQVNVAYDPELNTERGESVRESVALLEQAGATVHEIARIHNKTIAVDYRWIVEGSFNWLSAVRDVSSPYSRQERSLRYEGPLAAKFCSAAWNEVSGR